MSGCGAVMKHQLRATAPAPPPPTLPDVNARLLLHSTTT